MLVIADRTARAGWALRDSDTGVIALATVCESEGEARQLLREARSRDHGNLELVAILVSVQAVAQ